jgi:hypothetical protein
MKELDLVALRKPLPDRGLVVGDVGTIVLKHDDGAAYEVEFVVADGGTIAVETLTPDELEPVTGRRILHVRNLTAA